MQAFGIAALVFAIIGIFAPFVGIFLSGLSGILAFFSYGKGTTLGLSAIIINFINILFLSPTFWLAMAGHAKANNRESAESMVSTFIILLIIQAAALGFFANKKYGLVARIKGMIK